MILTIPTPRQIAIAANKMASPPAAMAPLCPYVVAPRIAASAEDRAALAILARTFDPSGFGTPEERAFKVARLIVSALTPGRIGHVGDDDQARQAAWVEVSRRAGYYLGTGDLRRARLNHKSFDLVYTYRSASGDDSALIP